MGVVMTYDQDDSVQVEKQLELGSFSVTIEAATTAGKTLSDTPSKPNEDTFSVVQWGRDIVAAVFDGATGQKTIPEIEPTTSARFASHALKEILETIEPIPDMKELVSQLNRLLGDKLTAFPSVDLADVNSLPTSTATIVKINSEASKVEVGHIGDSFAVALMNNGDVRLLTDNLHRAFDEKVLGLIGSIAAEKSISQREARADPLIKQAIMASHQYERNRPDGTGSGAVNSDPNMERYIHISSAPLNEVKAILIGSDGLLPPNKSEQSKDDQKWLFETTQNSGLQGLIQAIRQIEDEDPEWKYVRYKHSDDATGVLIRIS